MLFCPVIGKFDIRDTLILFIYQYAPCFSHRKKVRIGKFPESALPNYHIGSFCLIEKNQPFHIKISNLINQFPQSGLIRIGINRHCKTVIRKRIITAALRQTCAPQKRHKFFLRIAGRLRAAF